MRRTGVNVPGNLLEIMDRQANHLVRLVDDLLELSRIREGQIHIRPERVDLSQILQSALEAAKPSVEQADQSLVFNTEPETPTIQADPVRITQVFTNLFHNASKFTPAGGRIDVSMKRQGDYLVTTVRDDGRGISPEALPTIFELFRQAEDSSMHPTGLVGLALVKKIVELHHGTVEARSDGVDKGSEFVVSLPIA